MPIVIDLGTAPETFRYLSQTRVRGQEAGSRRLDCGGALVGRRTVTDHDVNGG